MVKFGREKRVSSRVHGLQLTQYEESGLCNNNIVQYALLKYNDDKKYIKSDLIRAEISFLRDKITECELLIESYQLSIEKKIQEYQIAKQEESEAEYMKHEKVASRIYDRYLEFMESSYLTEDFRSDVNNFYTYCSDFIRIIAMRYGLSYEECVGCFDEYMESLFVLENGIGMVDESVSVSL